MSLMERRADPNVAGWSNSWQNAQLQSHGISRSKANLMSHLTNEILSDLKRFDTPTVCNVIELFDVRPRQSGYMNGSIKACFPDLPPMVGVASTATFRALDPPRGSDVYAGLEGQLEMMSQLPLPPVVVFQDLDQPSAAATFGEVMCSTYRSFGSAGLITSGTGRDIDQVRPLQYPVFTSGTCCSHGNCHIISVHVPVMVGGLTVYPGDLLHGDCNGVTTIPIDIASEVAGACDDFAQAEKHVLEYVSHGSVTLSGFAEARAAMVAEIAALKRRLRPSS